MHVDVIRCVKQVLLIESFCILCPAWQLLKQMWCWSCRWHLAISLVLCVSWGELWNGVRGTTPGDPQRPQRGPCRLRYCIRLHKVSDYASKWLGNSYVLDRWMYVNLTVCFLLLSPWYAWFVAKFHPVQIKSCLIF